MSKHRKTRQEKIILQLKRQLVSNPEFKARQEAKLKDEQTPILPKLNLKKPDNLAFSNDASLIKTDLWKTLVLSLIVISFEIVLYLKLR